MVLGNLALFDDAVANKRLADTFNSFFVSVFVIPYLTFILAFLFLAMSAFEAA